MGFRITLHTSYVRKKQKRSRLINKYIKLFCIAFVRKFIITPIKEEHMRGSRILLSFKNFFIVGKQI